VTTLPVDQTEVPSDHKQTRRDFLYVLTGCVGAVGAAAALVPFISQMEPDQATLAAGGPVDLDLSKVQPGQQVVVRWRGRPVFVINRSPTALKTLQDEKLLSQLADAGSEQLQQADYAKNWHRSIKPEYGVYVGICTHLGCIPMYYPDPSASVPTSDWAGGYFCPCHGSKYDLAARVFRGVPAPYNLPVPPYHFPTDNVVRIGTNPPDSNFDFSSINQL
jgi:ubiquinol-cytochrome c reductase iron-sulfur subunit